MRIATALGMILLASPLAAGEIISTGTLTSGHSTAEGDSWTAEVTGLVVPPLTLRLS